jgi:replicative DNA helicase
MNYPTVFFSYELAKLQIYERFYQIVNQVRAEDVEEDYLKGRIQSLDNKLNTLRLVEDSSVKIEEIPDMIKEEERKSNIKYKMLVLDYLTLVKGGQGNKYERTSYIAESLKELAKKTQTVVFCLAQVSRGTADDPNINSGKDSGSIENVADLCLSLHRPDPKNMNYVNIRILKNRKGETNKEIECYFTGSTLDIKQREE